MYNNNINIQTRNKQALDNIPSEILHLERLKNKIKDIEEKIGGFNSNKSFNHKINQLFI